MGHELSILDTWAPEDEKAVETGLVAYNLDRFGPPGFRKLGIFLHDDDGKIEGGLIGRTGRGWLYTQMLFIPESRRGQGLARTLLTMAEEEARARGCIGAYIDSMNPAAVKIYEKLGYTAVGQLGPFAGEYDITWLAKRF
ncbi:GNAT family N-acetyltransferase [Rhizobiales bacterium RZME27]|uniref:GNAT family N-acetyltransferase n=1 Tax=Endobacterium cereale TaxID=2663029 RepID=A0A6A8AEF2_9HYPH|nr:GNAT family N-acetyltransferase [Endobacterium cereale]MQY49703.1 GNAT family N-acetyltransferase [Endobacterium cereale]